VAVSYDERTALVVVDMQNDFADPAGSLYVKEAEAVIDAANREIAAARAAGALVVYTQDWHPPDTPHFAKDGGTWPVHCVRDTWGAELHPRLEVVDGQRTRKGVAGEDGYSAFTVEHPTTGERHPTNLHPLLQEHGITRIVVVGLATDYCVRETAIDGISLGYEVVVVRDAVRPVDLQPGDGERALEEMAGIGVAVA